jgi:hypothetical protein
LASGLSIRVQEIMNRGGTPARTLKTNKNNVGDAIRDCVIKGSQLPNSVVRGARGKSKATDTERASGWEREVAVMVGSIVGHLGR